MDETARDTPPAERPEQPTPEVRRPEVPSGARADSSADARADSSKETTPPASGDAEAPTSGEKPAKISRSLKLRLLSAAVIVPTVIGLIVWGGFPFLLGVAAIIILALREFYEIIEMKGLRPQKLPGLVGATLLALVAFLGNEYQTNVLLDQRRGYVVVRAKITDAHVEVWERDLTQLIERGLRFQTQLAGVTGQQYLALDFHDPQRYPAQPFTWKPDYPYIPSAPSLAGQIVANAQHFLASLNQADIEQLGQNLNALAVTLNKKVEEVPVQALVSEASAVLKAARAIIDRADRVLAQAPIDETVRNLNTASARIDRLLADPALKQTVDDAAAVAARLRKITDSGELDRVVRNLDQTIQRADALLGNNQYDVRGIVQDLRVTADNLRSLSEVAKRYPAGLLIGGPPQKIQLPKEPR